MYGKIFASLYQGSLRGMADEILVFTNLLACADRDGFVDKHWKAIADEVGIPIDRVKSAINTLEAPDPESRSQIEEGRRLLRIDEDRAWGWFIVNKEKYDALKTLEDKRQANRLAQQRFRERKSKGITVIDRNGGVMSRKRKSASTSTSTSTSTSGKEEGLGEGKQHRFVPPTIEECKEEAVGIGIPMSEGEGFWHYYESNGWYVGRRKMKSWKSAMQNWKKTHEDRQRRDRKTHIETDPSKIPAISQRNRELGATRADELADGEEAERIVAERQAARIAARKERERTGGDEGSGGGVQQDVPVSGQENSGESEGDPDWTVRGWKNTRHAEAP